jgi:isoquinoline 1-oxidoreductase beta subunit
MATLKAANPPLALPPLGALTVDGEFEWRAATHCPLEVETAIADVRPGRCEIWAAMQTPIIALQSVAADLGLRQDQVVAHVLPAGGSFGRRLFWDPVQVAVQVSKATGRPCKLMYHRTDDVRQTRMRPPQVHKIRATLLLGNVIAYQQNVAAVRLDARHGYGEWSTATAGALPPMVQQTVGNLGYEEFFFKTMVSSPYNFGATTKLLTPVALEMNTVSFRSVHIQPARCSEEIIVDEIAKRLGKDPLAFRLEYLRLERARAVLQRVAGAIGWGRSMPAGTAMGISVHQESRSFTACAVELDAREPGNARVTRAVIAIDVGKPINPSGIRAQCEGGLADAISLVLKAGLTLRDGLPLESAYSSYPVARQRDFPKSLEIIVMPDVGEAIGGMGEVGFSAASGAIANAWARATGKKPRKFPLNTPPTFTPVPPGRLPTPAHRV